MNESSEKYLTVAQDNRICQTAYTKNKENDLTTYQKQLILVAIARVQKEDTEFKIETIPFKEFMTVMDIPIGGNTERKIAESVEALANKSFIIKEANGAKTELLWVNPEATRVDWSEKVIYIQLHSDLEKYLLNLSGSFTSFQLGFVANLKGKYSFRVYEYLHSYLGLGKLILKREDALKILGSNRYCQIADFDRYVLKKAIEEINEYTDLDIKYHRRIDRKTITHYFFIIRKKDPEDIELIQDEWVPRECEYDQIKKDFKQFLNPSTKKEAPNKKEKNNIYESEIL